MTDAARPKIRPRLAYGPVPGKMGAATAAGSRSLK